MGLEPRLRGSIAQRATAKLFHQLVFRERNKQYIIFLTFVYIEIYGVLVQQAGPKMTDSLHFARNSSVTVCDRMLRNNLGS